MTYREESDALRLRLQMAEAERDAHRHRAEAAEAELRNALGGMPTPETLKHDGWLTAAKLFLWVQFGFWILFVLVSVPTYVLIAYDDPPFGRDIEPVFQGLIMAGIVDAFFAPIGIGAAVGAVGLSRGRVWGWWVSLVVFALSCLCGCWLIGVGGMVILLRAPVRAAYLGAR